MPMECYDCKQPTLQNSKFPTCHSDKCQIAPAPMNCATMNLHNNTRIGLDDCYYRTRNGQNDASVDYMTRGFKDCNCGAKKVQDVAVNEPTMNYRDGFGWTSINGCNIDTDSNIRNSRNMTNMRYIQQLFTSPYLTVPYMGRGVVDAGFETDLVAGEDTTQKRPCNTLSGIYIDRFIPLVPCLDENIQNPAHIVQEVASNDWIRGGLPSRDLIRNTDYLKKCGLRR